MLKVPFFCFLFFCACPLMAAESPRLTVAVAANAVAPMQELASQFERSQHIHVAISSGATGLLARQLREGAPFDLFVSADTATVKQLAVEGLVTSSSIRSYARGKLILWVNNPIRDRIQTVQDLADTTIPLRLAIANPETAPYGAAARQVLQHLGIWTRVQPALVIGENVSNTFQLARTGNVDACFVARSVAAAKEEGIVPVPDHLYTRVEQALGVCTRSSQPQAAQQFAIFVTNAQSAAVWRLYGYDGL
jgi:molybdate transport system substrate-binding protein